MNMKPILLALTLSIPALVSGQPIPKERLKANTGTQPLTLLDEVKLHALCLDRSSGKILHDVELHRRHPAMRVARSRAVLPLLVATIIGQRVTGIQAARSWGSLATF